MFVPVWTNCSFRQNTIIHIENSSRKWHCLCPLLVQNEHNDLLETTRKKGCRHTSTHLHLCLYLPLQWAPGLVQANFTSQQHWEVQWRAWLRTPVRDSRAASRQSWRKLQQQCPCESCSQRQETEAMKEQLVSNTWDVLNWYQKGKVDPRSKDSRKSDPPSWEKSQAMGEKKQRIEIFVLEKQVACSETGQHCWVLLCQVKDWCPLALADVSVHEPPYQSHTKGLFMEKAIFKACRCPESAEAPVTVTGIHRPTPQIPKAETCRDFCSKGYTSDSFSGIIWFPEHTNHLSPYYSCQHPSYIDAMHWHVQITH